MRFQTTSICVLLMALTISSGYEVIPGREPNHVHDVCSTWGHFHYKTFDGDFYQFPGLCTYNLASDYRNHEFSVHIKRSTDTGQPLIKKIIATIKDIVIQMNSSSILVNEIEAELPYNNFGIFVEDTDVYLKMSTKIGLTLMWNKEDAIMLELQTKFRNVTRGLCGDYNGVPIYNEFITGGNRLTPSDFGNQQNVDDPSETCKNVDSTKMNDALNCSEYRSVCEQNLGHSAFSECIDILDTESYIQACMLDMCSCNQSQIQDMSCLCSTVTEYSRQCSHAGGKPGNWRTDSLCHKQCPLNMVFQESTSPCMSTCSHLAFPTLCTEHNIDGCFCPDGTVYDDYKRAGCVPISECSCISEGILYSTGQTMQRGCQKCHCISGTWSCIKQDCPGVCSIEGGAHFTTFDGKKYTFHGNCLYVLSKGIGVESYNIIGELSMCSYPQRATCLKSIILRDNATNTITFQANGHVLFNYQRITLPYITGGFSIIQPSDFYIIVQSTLGLQMQMQLFTNNMQLYISLDKSVKGNLQGLCGDFNSNANDDFVTYGGLVEATASAFANTWKADDMCPDQKEIHEDPCSLSIENKNYAEHWCSFLENKYSIFAKCHSAVPPQEYAKQCRYDSCNCKDSEPCMCAALSSYVQACAANGIILRDWKIGICDKYVSSCPLSQVYRYDITKRQPKCNSLAERGKVEDIEFIPVDGCGCPAGKYLNEKNQCVSISECSCYENGIYTNPLGIIMKGDQFCSCHNGKLACNTTSNRYQTCSPGKVYFDCNTQLETYTASVYRTCKTLGVENMKCSSGCVCPNELLDDGLGGCVPKDRCSCPHNNDMIPHGKTIKQDCNTCLCQSGHWNCTRYECYGTCTVYGSGHYITFDTRFYEFDGNCEFELAQDYCGNDFSQGSFRVITENIPCGTTGVTCSKAIRVILGNKELKLAEKHLQETQGEGEKSVQYLTREVGIYLVIEASNGILLIWDRKTSIIIKLPPKFKSKVCGLCGNFDDDSNNDFTTRQMLQVTSITEYGNSWKVNPACPDSVPEIHPCKMASHREAWAMKQCSLIKSDVFKVCHSKVDPAPFYEACVNDACSCDTGGDCECFCTVVAVYAQKCNQADVCVHWRTPDICPIFCDYYNPDEEACEWHYHACGNHKIQTCQYINNINTNVNITFLEGCYPTCPPDKPIFDEEKKICVTKEECGCYIYNTRYKPNEKVPTNNNCETCICTSQGKRHCYYEESACYCMVNGTRYNQHDIISKKSEAGICIVEICINGSISHNITICTTTTESITTTTAITQSVTSMTVSITPEIPSTTSFTEEATPTSIINTSLLLPTSTPVESTTSSATTTQSITTETTSVTTEIPSTSASTEFTTEETTQTSIVSTVPLSPTSTPMENTTTPITVTQSVTTVTVSETPESSSTTPSITECHDETVCSWSQWFNVTYPDDNGEFETYEAIKKKGYKICEKPSNISCRALSFPLTPLEELDTSVKCDVNFGLICNNAEEEDGHCYNYEIQVYCCEESTCTTTSSPSVTSPTITESVVTTISPTTSSLTQTTMPVITTTEFTTEETTQTSIVSTVPLSPTSTPMESTTTPIIVTQSVTTVTVSETPESSSTTPSITECHDETVCSWSQWFNVTYPDDNGEFETYEAIKKKGYKICEKPSNISCRALSFPLTPLEELDTSVKCDVNFGLICNNAEEEDGHCYNYEIQVYCCEESTCTTTSSPSVTSPTITESVVTTISPTTSSLTQTTMPVITTTEFTTEETTQTSIVSTVPLSPTSTPMESTTTPIIVTQSVTTVTVSETPESSSTTPSITECHDETVCSWSQWFNVTYPDDNGEFETYEAIKKKGYKICEKPSNISCRALSFPLTPLEELDTSVKCDVNFGLICNNAEEEDGHCYNYEIQVYCCEESTCTTTSSPSVTSPTITESVVTTISPTTTSLTQTTTPVITTTEFTTEETTQTSIVSTVPLSPTSTPMESTTTPIIVTQSVTTVTVSETPESSSTTPSITECHDETVCSWSQWFNVTYPDDNGEFETYEAIKKKGYKICEKPSNISCRALSFPLTPLEELDTSVKCDVNFGLICNNAEEEDGHCYNYEIQVYCCEESTCTTTSSPSVTSPTITESVVTTISPTTTSLTQTTTPVITTTEFTTEETTQTSIVSTVPLSPTSTPMESTTTPIIVTQSVTTVTVSETPESSSTTPSITECHDETVCSWSQWFNVTYPDDNGEFETYEAIKKKGYKICEKPSNISCRALSFPLTPLEELDTSVKCDVNFGLICNNAEEEDGHCYNYEIQVYCCEESTCTTTSSPSVTSPTITESVVTTISPTTTSLTQTTTPVITTTEFTTEETTQTSIVSTVPLSPTSTPMESTTTPIIVTQSVTTVTVSETPESSSTTPSITPCTPGKICNWSEWINVSSPKPDGDEYETYEEIRKNGYKICEKPENISCRSIKYPDNSMDSQNLTCDVQTGLTCYNKDQEGLQSFPICEDHEIRVYCCEEIICPIFSTPSTTITETFYTTITMATTQIHPTTEQTTEEITSTTTEATSTIPHTMSTEPPVWIRTFTTMIPTVTEQPQQNQTHESTTVLIPSVTSTTPEQTTSETSLSETTSIVTTEPPTSIPEFTISTLCHCLFDGKLYPPGVTITDGAANRTLCYTVICKDDCTLYIHQWSCETPTTPEVTSTTTISESTTTMTTELTSTSELTTPEKTTHSPESTLESTTTIQLISSRTTIPEYTTSNITEGCLLDPPRKHGEVWKLYNCTMARCLENKTIEIFKTQCVTPPPIKCVNGFSPDLVPDADGCCQHWECRCVCLGWGDPHYKTFDGTSYAYQGSCTYVLVEEINKKIPNFGIYIDNYECGNQVSCPRSIIVHYEDQKIQIKVISIPPPVLEVNVNGQLVGLPYNKEAIKIFVSGIFTRVYILTLNATISFSGVDYRVELPYQRFSNNTQGQCGTCTNNKTDDCMLPDGKIISNCEIMAASWIVNTTDKPGCLPIPPSTPTPPPTCIPSSLCELIKGPTFQECHNKLNPDDYYKACIFDSCRAPNISIECSSLQRYASLCIDEGICIDWRSKAPACRISCPSPKVYQPCGPAVTYTCKTTPEEKEANKNNTSMVEGCFCPNGTMLFSNAIDICTKDCGCIGLDNIPRKFGERFQLDCHDCICLEGGRGISCEKHQCPDVTNTCPLEGFYPVTQISSSDKCCNETKCYCDTSRCSNNIPNCTLGYEAKSVTPAGHCCPKYECVPKHVCVHENAEYQPGSQVYSGKCETCDCPIHGNISENIKIICHPVHCDLHCLAGYTLDYNSGDCCPRCIQTHCVLNDDGSTHLLKPGEILNKKNDNCTVYNCSENFILTSSNIICQEFFEADCEPGTIQYLPDGCCKTCERKNNSCTLQLSEDYLTYNNCRSLEKVQMSQCEGFCETFSKYSADAKSMQHKCSCCKEVRTSQKEVKMQCKDGSEVPYNYTYVEECNCVTNACDRVQSKRDTYRKEKRPKKTTLNV